MDRMMAITSQRGKMSLVVSFCLGLENSRESVDLLAHLAWVVKRREEDHRGYLQQAHL